MEFNIQDSGHLLLVNYGHSISGEYEPEDLVQPCGGEKPMRATAAKALENMVADLRAEGCHIFLDSGYRPYSRQNYLFTTRIQHEQDQGLTYEEAYEAVKMFTAVPGTSEHQLGLAMDLSVDGDLNAEFAETRQGKWLAHNCGRYGFVLRYQEEKYSITQIGFEPWHFRYVGLPHSLIMADRGWCLEEYLENLQNQGEMRLSWQGKEYRVCRTAGTPEGNGQPEALLFEGEELADVSSDNCGGTVWTLYREEK